MARNSTYQILTTDDQDDTIVAFFLAQERDHHSHTINLERYDVILKTAPDGPWRDRVRILRDETISRLAEVDTIISATQPQLPSDDRVQASITRLTTRGAIGG